MRAVCWLRAGTIIEYVLKGLFLVKTKLLFLTAFGNNDNHAKGWDEEIICKRLKKA